MLHRLNNACVIKRSDAEKILHILSRGGHGDLCNAINNALNEDLDGWVAVPYVACKDQLTGNTHCPISLKRWQSILESSPHKPKLFGV
jgi:hypothetical protein